MDRDAELLDLVCGPASPLPETHQRYRLVQHIASGGQAEVYRAVRLSGGISSAPVTVKVFRLGDQRPRADQLRSWDKGDAVLMDLNSRGVPGICRRADGFYGPPPHPPGAKPRGESSPYQVLDYLQGTNLRDYIRIKANAGAPLDAVGALDTLVRVLTALHDPAEPGASPVLHMDIKPSNVMVLPSGEVRLIDFTGARYHRAGHLTTIAYTLEAGGPEAFSGTVGPSYDVHGFGAVAYYMVTGAFPRSDSPQPAPNGAALPPWAVLRRHPVLDAAPALREHLLAPLADQPADRPATEELTSWVVRLAELVEGSHTPDNGMFWGVARRSRVVGRAAAVTPPGEGAWRRIERLEQELVELRSALSEGEPADEPVTQRTPYQPTRFAPYQRPDPVTQRVAEPSTNRAEPATQPTPYVEPATPRVESATQRTPATRPMAATADGGRPAGGGTKVMPGPPQPNMRGVASVPPPVQPRGDDDGYGAPGEQPERPLKPLPGAGLDTLRRGMGISVTGALFCFVCWGIWALSSQGGYASKALMLLFVLLVAVGLFVLCRLVGRLVFEQAMRRSRASARLSHLAVATYLVIAGVSFASRVAFIHTAYEWIYRHVA